jgi:hypothetical protein
MENMGVVTYLSGFAADKESENTNGYAVMAWPSRTRRPNDEGKAMIEIKRGIQNTKTACMHTILPLLDKYHVITCINS